MSQDDQGGLFDQRLPFNRSSETSRLAAMDSQKLSGRHRMQILQNILRTGKIGMTCDEVELVTGLRHQTASARVHELARTTHARTGKPMVPFIVKAGVRRKTRSGSLAEVYVGRQTELTQSEFTR